MTKLIVQRVSLSILSLFIVMSSAKADTEELVNVEPQTIYAPVGFDNNDDVVAVVDGYLPDTCYRLRAPQVDTDKVNKRILIQPKAVRFPGICLDMIIPYSTVVHLGVLPVGSYKITTKSEKVTERINIALSTNPNPDDYLYAPIDSAQVETSATTKPTARLYGRFMNTCLRMQEVRVINSGKTLEVLPIMKQLAKTEAGEPCENKEIPFAESVELPKLATGRYLLHVRSLNGQSVNEVFSNR